MTTTPPVDVEGLITDDLIAEAQSVLLASGHSAWGSTSGLRDVFRAILPGIVAQVRREAIEECANVVKKRAEDYHEEHGIYDPETGAWEYPGNGAETMGEWDEIEEAIRALLPAATGKGEG